jgi:hypothetical protein
MHPQIIVRTSNLYLHPARFRIYTRSTPRPVARFSLLTGRALFAIVGALGAGTVIAGAMDESMDLRDLRRGRGTARICRGSVGSRGSATELRDRVVLRICIGGVQWQRWQWRQWRITVSSSRFLIITETGLSCCCHDRQSNAMQRLKAFALWAAFIFRSYCSLLFLTFWEETRWTATAR